MLALRHLVASVAVALPFGCGGAFSAGNDNGGDGGGGGDAPPGDSIVGDSPVNGDAGVDGGACLALPGVPNLEMCTAACTTQKIVTGSGQAAMKYPFGIATSGEDVFWAAQDDYNGNGTTGAIWKAKRDVNTAAPLLMVKAGRPTAIALDSTRVYWTDRSSTPTSIQTVTRDCTGACTPTTIGSLDQASVIRVVAEGDIFVAGDGGILRAHFTGSAWKVDTVGTAGQYSQLAYDGLAVYYSTAGFIKRISRDGATISTLAASPVDASGFFFAGLLSDCTTLYAPVSGATAVLYEHPVAGGSWTNVPTGPSASIYATAIDEKYVYFGNANGGGVMRFQRTGSALALNMAPGLSTFGLAVDEKAVYFGDHSNNSNGDVYEILK
jgi:hypothetical protein